MPTQQPFHLLKSTDSPPGVRIGDQGHACEGACGPPKVGGAIGAPEDVGVVVAQALVYELEHVLLVALPGLVHVPGGKARIPRPELCMGMQL